MIEHKKTEEKRDELSEEKYISNEDSHKLNENNRKSGISQRSEKESISNRSRSDLHDIGRWAEEYVFKNLQKEIKERGIVIWNNQNDEAHYPYDIVIKMRDGNMIYVEVKGTTQEYESIKDDEFELSEAEWEFLNNHVSQYVIYRVYGVGTKNTRYKKIENILNKIKSKEILFSVEKVRLKLQYQFKKGTI